MIYIKQFRLKNPRYQHLHWKEKLAAHYFLQYPNEFIVPIIAVGPTRYTVSEGTPLVFNHEFIFWLEELWIWLSKEEYSHNDIGYSNIICYQGSFRLIDFETWDFSGSTYKDFNDLEKLHKMTKRNLRG